jgi:hypothetical protein
METGKDNNMVGWNAGCAERCLSGVGSAGRRPPAEKQQGAVLRLHDEPGSLGGRGGNPARTTPRPSR